MNDITEGTKGLSLSKSRVKVSTHIGCAGCDGVSAVLSPTGHGRGRSAGEEVTQVGKASKGTGGPGTMNLCVNGMRGRALNQSGCCSVQDTEFDLASSQDWSDPNTSRTTSESKKRKVSIAKKSIMV